MNNGAFQKLVREKANIKTAKEIAREAVEAEFKEGKRKRRQNSSSDDDDSDNKNVRRKDRRRVVKDTKPKDLSEMDRLALKYRDLAKERREGMESDSLAENKTASDQIFDVVVQAFECGDRHKLKRIQTAKSKDSKRLVETADQALAWIAGPNNFPTTSLGSEVLNYLRRQYLPVAHSSLSAVSAAGRNLQQSKLTFSLVAEPRDRWLSWEHPLEQTYGAGILGDATIVPKATPCGDDLLREMERCLGKHYTRKKEALKDKKIDSSILQPSKEGPRADDGCYAATDDEDDDIFGNVGDYDGSAVAATSRNEAGNPSESLKGPIIFVEKGFIFHNKCVASCRIKLGKNQLDMQNYEGVSRSLPLVGLSSLQSGYGDGDIGMDCDDDDKDDGKTKTKKKTRQQRRAERSPS